MRVRLSSSTRGGWFTRADARVECVLAGVAESLVGAIQGQERCMCIEQRRRARTDTASVWLGAFRSRTNLRRVAASPDWTRAVRCELLSVAVEKRGQAGFDGGTGSRASAALASRARRSCKRSSNVNGVVLSSLRKTIGAAAIPPRSFVCLRPAETHATTSLGFSGPASLALQLRHQ